MVSKELQKELDEMKKVIAGLSKTVSVLEERLAKFKDVAERNAVNIKQLKDFSTTSSPGRKI